ncbi:type II secretion system F family protein, partial [Desulfovibrio sp. XJ01]|nr:type II secretion system F family protein [Nitratidesulfovibrio liaohensis]
MTFDETMIPFLAALLASGAVLLVAQALRGMFGNRQRVQRMHGRLARHAAGARA